MRLFEMAIIVILCAAASIISRFLPFFVFSGKKPTPRYIQYLGRVLPPATYALIIIFCLRNVPFISSSYGLPELISIIAIVGVHILKRNVLLSISVGTVLYMFLIQFIFV